MDVGGGGHLAEFDFDGWNLFDSGFQRQTSFQVIAIGRNEIIGRIVAAGTPEELVALGTHTGRALEPVLART